MDKLMAIFRSWGNFSEAAKKAVVRDNVAVLEEWKSKLSWRRQVQLRKPVVGYYGQTGPQKEFAPNAAWSEAYGSPVESIKEFRLGGFNQIVIPRFYRMPDSEGKQWGVVSHEARL